MYRKMNTYTFTIVFLFIFTTVQTSEYVKLTASDKKYLLQQLPKNHKLSLPMQQIINQTYIEIPEDRTKRQFMLFHPQLQPQIDTYETVSGPPSSYQLNLPIIAQPKEVPSYVFVANPNTFNSQIQPIQPRRETQFIVPDAIKQFTPFTEAKHVWEDLGLEFTKTTFNLNQVISGASDYAINAKPGLYAKLNIPIGASTVGIYKMPDLIPSGTSKIETSVGTSNILSTTPILVTPTTPALTTMVTVTPASTKALSIATTAPTLKPLGATTPNLQEDIDSTLFSILDLDVPDIKKLKHLRKVDTPNDMQAVLVKLESDISELIKPRKDLNDIDIYNKNMCESTNDQNSSTPALPPLDIPVSTQSELPNSDNLEKTDSPIKEKLVKILESVESIKSKQPGLNEGLPCSIQGKWVSSLAGSGFNIEHKEGRNFNVPLFHSHIEGFLDDGSWKATASTPLTDGGIFILTAIRGEDFIMATFTGECRTCNGEEMMTGHWLMMKPSLTCEEMNRGQDFFGDTWKKQSPNANTT